jgi:hypothetical protein
MNLDYKEKYLKYKSKYLLTKSQQGGVLTLVQKNIVKENIIIIFSLTIEQLKRLSASDIKMKIKEIIDTFDKSGGNSHIYEKILLLHLYLIDTFGTFGPTIINDSNKEKFLNAMIEHILNHVIDQTQFFSLLQNYKP